MNYPPPVRKEIKAYQKMRKAQIKELAKLQLTESKLAKAVEALTEKHTAARLAVMRTQKAHSNMQGPMLSKLMFLTQQHNLNLTAVMTAANQFNLEKLLNLNVPPTEEVRSESV
jgi:hypothetical protein